MRNVDQNSEQWPHRDTAQLGCEYLRNGAPALTFVNEPRDSGKGRNLNGPRRGTLQDITCDSDGKIDRFIDLQDVKDYITLHPLNNKPYYLGIYLTGAYQDIMGDLHNLFGRVNEVHVFLEEDEPNGFYIEEALSGSKIADVIEGVTLTVCNTPGVASWPDADKLFQQYYRSTGAKSISGTGLGLFLVRNICTLLGGTCSYEPTDTHVRFKVWLPH